MLYKKCKRHNLNVNMDTENRVCYALYLLCTLTSEYEQLKPKISIIIITSLTKCNSIRQKLRGNFRLINAAYVKVTNYMSPSQLQSTTD